MSSNQYTRERKEDKPVLAICYDFDKTLSPDDINIKSLVDRVEQENIKEIIIAVKPSIEGETTALYISKIFENTQVLVTKIAHGVPLGTDMDYIDTLTLELALEDRKKISN